VLFIERDDLARTNDGLKAVSIDGHQIALLMEFGRPR
jgi:hypothetical protein